MNIFVLTPVKQRSIDAVSVTDETWPHLILLCLYFLFLWYSAISRRSMTSIFYVNFLPLLVFLIIHNMFHHWCCYRCWSVASFFLCFSCWSFFLVVSLTVTHHIEECVPYIHAIGCANYTCRSPVSFRHSSIHIDCYVYMCAYVLFRIQRCQIGLHGKVRALEVRWWLSLGPTCIMAAQLKSWWIIVSLHQLSGKLVTSDQY